MYRMKNGEVSGRVYIGEKNDCINVFKKTWMSWKNKKYKNNEENILTKSRET